ncbi:MAG: class I SAM-dependent methyltransferase, partial [Chloroflexi bacterium]|nr:class I SAM-dependent methyltransferase [Chloroflexota bacterium]
MRYAEMVPSLVRAVEEGSLGRQWQGAPERLLRFLHYNVYAVPWRSFEILDVLRRHTGRSDLAGLRVLDLGCGIGTMDLYLALEGKAEMVVGVDRDRSSFGLLDSLLPALQPGRIALVQGDLAHPPVARQAFDVVLSYDSLYYPGLSRQVALD